MATSKISRGTILFVGRTTLDLEMLRSHVGQFGLACVQVDTAIEALDHLETHPYDLLIIDDTLPEHSTVGFIAEMARQKSTVPFLLFGTHCASILDLGHNAALEPIAALDKPLSLLQFDHILMSRLTGASLREEFSTSD